MDNDTSYDSGLSIEYAIIARQLETRFQLAVPIDEIVILTMFIIESEKKAR